MKSAHPHAKKAKPSGRTGSGGSRASRAKDRWFGWMGHKWGRMTVRGWLEVLGILLAGLVVYSLLFVRREVLEYRPTHQFTVRDPAFFASAHAASDPIPIEGNKITLLHNGAGIFPPMLEAIRAAQKTVNFEAFILHSGEVGNRFLEAFIDRARAGVQVRILLDGVGSSSALDNDDVKRLKDAGCKFAYYHPTKALRLDRLNRRTHRRVLVIDGRLAFTGGAGFADDWRGNADAPKHWREVHAQLEGPIVAKLQTAFQQHWLGETEEMLGGPDHFPPLSPAGNLRAQVTGSTEFSVAALPLTQAIAIASAEKSILITNPYCTPNEDQVHLLSEAVKRGVDVRLLLPGQHNDQPWTKAAGRGSYGDLLEAGVKIFEYEPTMIHSKTMVVDGLFSLFGTSNLDARSSAINEEIDISVYDEGFGKEMEKVFEKDLEKSKPYTLEQFKKRGLWERFIEWAVLPFRSQL